MQGHNALFVANCLNYLNGVIVDNVNWFRNVANGGALAGVNLAKFGQFDLMPSGINPARTQFRVAPPPPIIGDAGIAGYWCPFLQGNGLPGWVDLPRVNPASNFMFTPAMQGCALVVTNPGGGNIRVYHHQHPEDTHIAAAAIWGAINHLNHPIISILEYNDYGTAGLHGNAPNAFNFLYYRNATWNYVTQAHTLDNVVGPNGLTLQVNRRMLHGNNGVSIQSLE